MHSVSREESVEALGRVGNITTAVRTGCHRSQSGLESSANMAAITDVSPSVMDEFSHFEESSFGACEGFHGQDQAEDPKRSSQWELLITMYLPLAALWLRRSAFGITMLVRTMILGHLLRLIFGNFTDWMHEYSPSCIQTFWQPISPHVKPDPKAWPPPALTALALFTVLTLVVHPDGFTWIMMGKAKNAVFSVLASLSEFWQLLISDYGLMSSIIASVTLAAIIFFIFIMLRSITQRKARRPPPTPDKRKKKRKGHARHRGGSGKIKYSPSPSRAREVSPLATSREATSPVKSFGENAPDLTPLTPTSSVHYSNSLRNSMKKEVSNRGHDELPETCTRPTAILTIADKATMDKDLRGRSRVASVSTLDTTTMSDDLSCGSTSIRSLPSIGVSAQAALNSSVPFEHKSSTSSTTSSTARSIGDQKLKSSVSNSRRNKRLGTNNPKPMVNSKGPGGPSRWDSLKPTTPAAKLVQSPVHQTSNSKSVENVSRHHLQPPHAHRVSIRRAGRGGGVPKNGRGVNQYSSNRSNNTSRSPTETNPFATRSPVSPPSLAHQDCSRFSLPPLDSLPLSPLGLGLTSAATMNEGCRLFPSQQKTSFSDAPYLLPLAQAMASPDRSWDRAAASPPPSSPGFVSPSFLTDVPVESDHHTQEWNNNNNNNNSNTVTFGSSSARSATSSRFYGSPRSSRLGFGGVKENPFAPDSTVMETFRDSEEQIEADLQELGGRMVGSILDF